MPKRQTAGSHHDIIRWRYNNESNFEVTYEQNVHKIGF